LPRTWERVGVGAGLFLVTDGLWKRPSYFFVYCSKMVAITPAETLDGSLVHSVPEPELPTGHSALRRITIVSPGCWARNAFALVRTSSKLAFW
jgi:hypothetical protein